MTGRFHNFHTSSKPAVMQASIVRYTLLGSVLLASCGNLQSGKLGMKNEEISDSNEEAISHSQTLETEIESTGRKLRKSRTNMVIHEVGLEVAEKCIAHHKRRLLHIPGEERSRIERINSRDMPQYPTTCRNCGASCSLNRDAFTAVINSTGVDGTTYRRTSYQWFLWAEWDHHTYITRQELGQCLSCCSELGDGATEYCKEELEKEEKNARVARQKIGSEQQRRQLLENSLAKDKKTQKVLKHQSARKLFYKRKLRAVEQEKAKLAKETAAKEKRLKEKAALELLKLGIPVQNIVQATGLSEASVNSLRNRE